MSQAADLASFTVTLEGQAPQVLSFEGTEGISSLPLFTLRLFQPTEYASFEFLTPHDYIGRPLRLTLHSNEHTRHICGIVWRMDLLSFSHQGIEYEVELASSFARLQLNASCRIFQQLSTPEIVTQLIQEHGLQKQLRWMLAETYPPRDYCVQYQESDWDFIARLLEEEGIFFALEHHTQDILVCGDGPHAYSRLPAVMYRPEAPSHLLYDEALRRFEGGVSLRPTSATLRDYRFKSPGVVLESQASGDFAHQGGELYFYPGEFQTLDIGSRLTRARIGEAQTGGTLCRGEGNIRGLHPGDVFELQGHPVSKLARPWLVSRLQHRGAQSQALQASNVGMVTQTLSYQVELEGIPHDQRFVPARRTPRPQIPGLQSAIVVGPSGETLYTDTWGRVKVKFHWDRLNPADESASCWIRVSQAWAGQQFGVFFLPRIGQEVLVQFIEGDPDRPVIIGRVYNDYQKVPYRLPERKTVSTFKTNSVGGSGYNELRFEDLAGQEEVWVHGQRDWNIIIEALKDERIGHNKHLRVGQDHTISVGKNKTETVGMNELSFIGQNRTQQVGRNEQRKVTLNRQQYIGVDDNLKVSGKQLVEVRAHEQIHVKNAHEVSLKKSGLLKTLEGPLEISTQDHLGLHAKTYIKLTCGESSLTLNADGSIYLIGKKVTLKGGSQLKLKAELVMLNPPSLTTPPEEAGSSSGEAAEVAQTEPEQAAAPAPEASGSSAPQKGVDPIADIQSDMAKSPSLQKMYDEASQQGISVKYGAAGGGSYMDRGTNSIVIDPNDSARQTAVIAHELGHATYNAPPYPTCAGKSMEQYADEAVNWHMADEGNAVMANAVVQDELAAQGKNISLETPKEEEAKKIAKDPQKSHETKCAELGDLFGKYANTSNTGQNYDQYYRSHATKNYKSGRC
ncbi:MAG: type VI secretion system tip protein TssI/VgrG [Myxococcota bacterium]